MGWRGHSHPAYGVNAQWSLAVSGTGKIFSRKRDPRRQGRVSLDARSGHSTLNFRLITDFGARAERLLRRPQIERDIIMIECSLCVAIPMLLIVGLVGVLAVLVPPGSDIL